MTNDMNADRETLERLLSSMAVPVRRRDDLRWLLRNLAIHNADHPNFTTTIQHVRAMLRKETNDN